MTYAMAAFRSAFQRNDSGHFVPSATKENTKQPSPSLSTAALGLARNCAITVVIGSAMLLQGPDGGIHDLGLSWSLKIALMLVLGLVLNFRKVNAFGRALETTLRARAAKAAPSAGFRSVTA